VAIRCGADVVAFLSFRATSIAQTTRAQDKGGKINGVTVVETERLVLREFDPADVPALQQVFADPYARQFYASLTEREAARAWIDNNIERYRRDGHGLWAACLRETGEMIGDCGLVVLQIEGRARVEVGYHVRADWRGRGLASEAASACMEFGFRDLLVSELVSMVHPANEASRVVASRLHHDCRRFMRHGAQYYLFSTRADTWRSRLGQSVAIHTASADQTGGDLCD
jgi:RimJ/RimL family protein N-acetyltransferase